VSYTGSVEDAADQFSGQFEVIELRPEDPRWRGFVAGRSEALPYHHPAWSHVLQETFGYRLTPLGCIDATGRLVGVLPLVEKKSLLRGTHLSSLPNTPTAGPLSVDRDSYAALLSGAAARVDHSAAKWLQLKVEGPAVSGLARGFSGSSWGATYVLDLPQSPDLPRFGDSRHNSAIRRNVRKAARHGVTVREASSVNDVRRWYRLYLETMRAHGVLPRPPRLFEVIWDILMPLGIAHLLLAERSTGGQSRLMAGSLFLSCNQTVIFAFNGRDRTQLEFRPNDAIHWQAICGACEAHCRRYDFGGVPARNEGLSRFKEKWGAIPVDLYRYNYPRQREVEQGVLGSGPFLRAAELVCRRLPPSAAAALGEWVNGRL
jgi:CelD/BcsL family acetyltransferase involved in cellulose biosynthesis